MCLKGKIRKVLRKHYGKFESYLEHIYEDKLTENLIVGGIEERRAWATYNQVILELKHSLKDLLRVKELQYKLTETTTPNEACIEVIEEVKHYSPELERLYYKITNLR